MLLTAMCPWAHGIAFPLLLQDVLSRFKAKHGTKWDLLPEKATFQLNDTHPTMAMAELTRLLVDEEGLPWEQAVKLTSQVRGWWMNRVCFGVDFGMVK